jgi:hypothetical protein
LPGTNDFEVISHTSRPVRRESFGLVNSFNAGTNSMILVELYTICKFLRG